MRLNEVVPGLPRWPNIIKPNNAHEYVVSGTHVSHGRYVLTQWTLGLGYFFFAFILSYGQRDFVAGFMMFILLLIPFAVVAALLPLSRILCKLFFPEKTLVRFTPQSISIGGQVFETASNVAVQFRANRPAMAEGKFNNMRRLHDGGKLKGHASYELKFRKVEMIYGSRIVFITSVADPDRAEQFAVALQIGYDLSGARQNGPAKETAPRSRMVEDALPE